MHDPIELQINHLSIGKNFCLKHKSNIKTLFFNFSFVTAVDERIDPFAIKS